MAESPEKIDMDMINLHSNPMDGMASDMQRI